MPVLRIILLLADDPVDPMIIASSCGRLRDNNAGVNDTKEGSPDSENAAKTADDRTGLW